MLMSVTNSNSNQQSPTSACILKVTRIRY